MDSEHGNPRFETDIKPLFRETDRDAMEFDLDLWDYKDVREDAKEIYSQVSSNRMPCDRDWTQEQKDLFRRWMDTGMAE